MDKIHRFGGPVTSRTAKAGLTAVLAVAATFAGVGSAYGKQRPDLTVSAGTVKAAAGKLSGSFVLDNDAAARARRSTATLVVGTAGGEREAARFRLGPLAAGASRVVPVAATVPAGLPAGTWPLRACADARGKVRESGERNNCRRVGAITIAKPPPPPPPPSTVPTDPVPFTKSTPFTLTSPQSNYWVYVPTAYDATHQTPSTVFVWLHGCGGFSSGDIYSVSLGGSQDWISVAVGGREGSCWNVNTDAPKVLAAIADLKTHFNVAPRRVLLGGYSSGGDLTYRTAFYNSGSFAGILVANSSPFRDTGSSQSASLAAATTKFHVVHLAHLQDTTYPIAGVRTETNAMTAAGFPLQRVEVDGGHYDDAGAIENGHAVPGTTADIATYLLPHIDDGWLAPPLP